MEEGKFMVEILSVTGCIMVLSEKNLKSYLMMYKYCHSRLA